VRRLYRLAAPAIAFVLIGSLLLLLAPSSAFELYGGLTTSALYALAIQITLSLFLFTAVDDLEDPRLITPRRDVGREVNARDSAANAFAIKHALMSFYLWRPLPAFLLALGGSMSIGALAIGLFDRPFGIHSVHRGVGVRNSEIALVAVLAVTALPQLLAGRRGFFGWTIGFSAGAAIAQITLSINVDAHYTALVWSSLAIGLCAARIISLGIATLLRRRKSHDAVINK
jgi:hypothetical protein